MDNAQVTQEAREAAARLIERTDAYRLSPMITAGDDDGHYIVQAFAKFERDTLARHRLERSEPVGCAGCEGHPALENNPCAVCGRTTPPEPVAEIERLRGALREIATVDENGLAEYTPQAMVAQARQALKDTTHD